MWRRVVRDLRLRLLRALWPSMADLFDRVRDVVEAHRAERGHPRRQCNAINELAAQFDVVSRESDTHA